MNIKITTFSNPFSFFFVTDKLKNENCDLFENIEKPSEPTSNAPVKKCMSDANHGHYVLVMWKNKWSRGVVDMGTQFLIWLIDYGIFIHPDEKTVFIDLPLEYRKYPTKVFEASIHGVVPLDKTLDITEDCKISNIKSTQWNQGTVQRAHCLIKKATKTLFYPIAILTTKYNDIILGDLILELPNEGKINLIDNLEIWPIFLERNQDAYLKDLSSFYNSRRHHRACVLKPSLPNYDLPCITLQNANSEYIKIVNSTQKNIIEQLNCYSSDETDGSISTTMHKTADSAYKITPADIEKYSKRYIFINGREYNVLNVLVNKARDMRMCEQYKDLDRKSIGRGYSYREQNF